MRIWLALVLVLGSSWANALPMRVVAANLTSGNHQSYSPDNGNHSNPEGAGARILRGLRPDVALVQEFNTTVPVRQWVNATFGEEFSVYVEPVKQPGSIPNGIVSRWPIVESGEWDDASQTNREFAWAKIALPDGKFLWAISVHLYAQKPAVRVAQARALTGFMRERIPAGDFVVLGGDFNTQTRGEECVNALAVEFDAKRLPAVDPAGDGDTNAPRNKPYDWVLADRELAACSAPTRIGAASYPNGLVFDSRGFTPLADVAPVQLGDSATPSMQHMAVVRDFVVP